MVVILRPKLGLSQKVYGNVFLPNALRNSLIVKIRKTNYVYEAHMNADNSNSFINITRKKPLSWIFQLTV